MSIAGPGSLTPAGLPLRAPGTGAPGQVPVAVKAALAPLPQSYSRHGRHKPPLKPGTPACGTLAICSAGVPTVSQVSNARVFEPTAYHPTSAVPGRHLRSRTPPHHRRAAPWRTAALPVRLPRVLSRTVARTARQKETEKRPVEGVPWEMSAKRGAVAHRVVGHAHRDREHEYPGAGTWPMGRFMPAPTECGSIADDQRPCGAISGVGAPD